MSSEGADIDLLRVAVRDGTSDVMGVAHEVGASAAQLGVPLHEVLDHVERAHAPDPPDAAVVRAAALAWAEAALERLAHGSCEDPLTSLATPAYLRSRLAEIYRAARRDDRPVAETHVLVVVELPRPGRGNRLEVLLAAVDVAEVLRTVFTGGETLVQLCVRRFAALVAREQVDPVTTRLVALLLDEALTVGDRTRLWVEQLPAVEDGLTHLLAALAE